MLFDLIRLEHVVDQMAQVLLDFVTFDFQKTDANVHEPPVLLKEDLSAHFVVSHSILNDPDDHLLKLYLRQLTQIKVGGDLLLGLITIKARPTG